RKALDTAAAFQEGTDPKGSAKGGTAAVKFRNASWEITLQLEPDEKNRIRVSGKSTIKNINPSRRTLSLATLPLRRQQGSGGSPVEFAIPAEYLAWDQSAEIRSTVVLDGSRFKGPQKGDLKLEQVFTWQASPLRRVDNIVLGAHAHRTRVYGLDARK